MPTDPPASPERRRRDRRRALGTALAVLAVAAAVPLLWLGVRELADRPDVDQVALQLAGSREAACRVLQPGQGCPVADAAVRRYRAAVQADGYLLAGWLLAGLGVFGLSALFLSGSGARRVARWCLGGVLLAGAADAAENLALLAGLSGLGDTGGDGAFAAAASLSVLKFAVGGPLLPVAVVFAGVLLGRRLSRGSRVRREDGGTPEVATASELEPGTARRPDIILPAAVADASTATLSATVGHSGPDVQQQLYDEQAVPGKGPEDPATAAGGGRPRGPATDRWRNAGRVPPGRPPAEVGICASGGGIRSASVTLGALQAMRDEVLSRARYLVLMSGGGYMTGAFQLALTRANPEADSLAEPGDVFAPGSAEEDHLRRHGRYLADGGREWLLAAGVVLRGVAASLGLLTLGVVVIGVALNAFYRAAPVVDITGLVPSFDRSGKAAPAYPAAPAAVWRTLAALAAVAVAARVLVLIALLAEDRWARRGRWAHNVFGAAVGVATVVAVYALVVPAVVWGMARLTWATGIERPVPAASFTAVATTLLTWFGALASTLWRRTELLRASGDKVSGLGRLLGRKPKGEVVEQQVATGLGQRLIAWAVHGVLGFVFVFVAAWTTAAAHRWPGWPGPALLGVLLAAGSLIDQTWLSLHPFYRGRLASAFAVRRASAGSGPAPWRRPASRPCGATSPSRRRWPCPGGVRLRHGPPRRRHPAAAGPVQRPARHLAAQPGVPGRAGPAQGRLADPAPAERPPAALPAARDHRRLPGRGRMLLCTDGGHWENLGLVELLRHRCRTVVCIDASGARWSPSRSWSG